VKATEELKEEHRTIKLALAVIVAMGRRLDAGEEVPPDHMAGLVDFIRNFADRCHHRKEEDLLFVEMAAAGIPREGGPVGVMLAEHEEGRDYVRGMAGAAVRYKAGEKDAGAAFAADARAYADLLAQHIDKEDNVLYIMADRVLSAEQQKRLEDGFARVEEERMGPGQHEKYHAWLHDLAAYYGVAA